MSDCVPGFVTGMGDPDWRLLEQQDRYHRMIAHTEACRKAWDLPEDTPISMIPMLMPEVQAALDERMANFQDDANDSPETTDW